VWKEWVKTGHRRGANKNNVSVTVTIKPGEWEDVGKWMWENRENFTALSCLPFSDHSYVQAPFEDVDEETYNELVGHLHEINLDDVVEVEDVTNLQGEAACSANGCEVT
jgi:ribonucleoside-diphosphate reductase alpha chain